MVKSLSAAAWCGLFIASAYAPMPAQAIVIFGACSGGISGYAHADPNGRTWSSYTRTVADPSCLSGAVNDGVSDSGSYSLSSGITPETAAAESSASVSGSVYINNGTYSFSGLGSTGTYAVSHAARDLASGAIISSIPGSAVAKAQFAQSFSVTTPTNYVLVVGSLTEDAFLNFNGSFRYGSSSGGGFSLFGTLVPGSYSISASSNVTAAADAAAGVSVTDRAATAAGRFDWSLQLTPVPIPAAVWLFLSGLGAVAATKRRTLQ